MANDQLSLILEKLEKLDSIDRRLVSVESKVSGIDERLVSIESKVSGIDQRLVSVENKVTALDNKIMPKEELEGHFRTINQTFIEQKEHDDKRFDRIQTVSENVLELVSHREQDYNDLRTRVEVLEETKKEKGVFRKLAARST